MNNKKLDETANISVVKKSLIAVGVMALSLALLAGPVSAGNNFANVIANAECVVDNGDVLVTASLEQKPKAGPGTYEVGDVTFILEEHERANMFAPIVGSTVVVPVNASFVEVDEGESVDVASNLYLDICNSLPVDPTANAVRAVVEVEVLNSNDKRKAGLIHTGRCISFANPCQ